MGTAFAELAAVWPAAGEEGDQLSFPAVIMRGGTSRGAFLLADDLPADPGLRDRVILAAYGSPDVRQIDGIGGATPVTSKVAIVSRSPDPGVDVDYLFGQVSIDTPIVDYGGNCGNLLAAVGPFAVDQRLVRATEPVTRVAIHNVNTRRLVVAEVPVVGSRARTSGELAIAGVPGTGAPILLDFAAAAGTLGRGLLPTGRPREHLDGLDVSIVDAGNPTVFVAGTALGDYDDLDAERIGRLRRLREAAGRRLGLASEGIPKVYAVWPPGARADADVLGRGLSFGSPHPAYAATVAVCTAVASRLPDTVVAGQLRSGAADSPELRIGHPSGVLAVEVELARTAGGTPTVRRAALARTARRLVAGLAYVPRSVL
jgi:2-methylaconitate cis-trans-isomerase PrpF